MCKKRESEVPKKHVFFSRRPDASPGAMPPSGGSQDVRPRRPGGAIRKGEVKANSKKDEIWDQALCQRSEQVAVGTKTTCKPIFSREVLVVGNRVVTGVVVVVPWVVVSLWLWFPRCCVCTRGLGLAMPILQNPCLVRPV